MARLAITDYLQSFPFWMMDVGAIGALALPVFNPALGFASISAPEISLDEHPIREANWYFDRKVVQRGNINAFTARRGVSFYDSDFYRWTMAGLTGNTSFSIGGATYRRDFVLIHFFARNPIVDPTSGVSAPLIGGSLSFGPFEFAVRVPAKAYMLRGCVPGRWRSGNDFDALDGSVSIAELDFHCEMVEEVSLAGSFSNSFNSSVSSIQAGINTLVGF